ncbi:MAG: choice-of-anchor L domain-containing protein [Solirubrobacterales bacterium]|nr:choice-of-anchor L domain-containing protein [Solirubrobacterales bacterium]
MVGLIAMLLVAAPAQAAIVEGSTNPANISKAMVATQSPPLQTGSTIAPSPYGYSPSPSGIGKLDDGNPSTPNVPLAGFPTEGDTFAVLTNGDAELADDPNNAGASGVAHGSGQLGAGRELANDPTILRVDINVPQNQSCVAFDFKFLSEEFFEFVDAGVNDTFVGELGPQPTWTTTNPDGTIVLAPDDFAAGEGDLISVDSQGPSAATAENAAGTTYDGATPILIGRTPVKPGLNSLHFSIFDLGDSIYDSAVFLDNLRTTNETGSQCKSLAVDPYEGTTGTKFPGDDGDPGTPINLDLDEGLSGFQTQLYCDLPAGSPIGCTNNLGVTLNLPSGETATKKAKLLASTAPTAVAGGEVKLAANETKTVKVPTTNEGKAALQATSQQRAAAEKAARAAKKKAKKAKKKAKKAKKKAKKLKKKGKKGKKKAKKLKKKAKKLNKQAKRQKKKQTAKKQEATELATATGTLSVQNPDNGTTAEVAVQVVIP